MRRVSAVLLLSHSVCGLTGWGLAELISARTDGQQAPSHERVAGMVHRQAIALSFQFGNREQALALLRMAPGHTAPISDLPDQRMLNALREASLQAEAGLDEEAERLTRGAEPPCRRSRDRDCRLSALAAHRLALSSLRRQGVSH